MYGFLTIGFWLQTLVLHLALSVLFLALTILFFVLAAEATHPSIRTVSMRLLALCTAALAAHLVRTGRAAAAVQQQPYAAPAAVCRPHARRARAPGGWWLLSWRGTTAWRCSSSNTTARCGWGEGRGGAAGRWRATRAACSPRGLDCSFHPTLSWKEVLPLGHNPLARWQRGWHSVSRRFGPVGTRLALDAHSPSASDIESPPASPTKRAGAA